MKSMTDVLFGLSAGFNLSAFSQLFMENASAEERAVPSMAIGFVLLVIAFIISYLDSSKEKKEIDSNQEKQ